MSQTLLQISRIFGWNGWAQEELGRRIPNSVLFRSEGETIRASWHLCIKQPRRKDEHVPRQNCTRVALPPPWSTRGTTSRPPWRGQSTPASPWFAPQRRPTDTAKLARSARTTALESGLWRDLGPPHRPDMLFQVWMLLSRARPKPKQVPRLAARPASVDFQVG